MTTLPSPTVHDPGAQLNFESLAAQAAAVQAQIAAVQASIPTISGQVLQLAVAGTQRRLAFGSTPIALTSGGAYFASTTVSHGLGPSTTPIAMGANARQSAGLQVVSAKVQSPTATQITLLAFITSGASPTSSPTIDVDWWVIG